MGKITLILIGALGLVLFIIYATVKTKTTSIAEHAPFLEWMGKSVTLNRETTLFKEKLPAHENNKYPFVLLDSLHPAWESVAQQLESGDLEKIRIFPKGTSWKIEQAIQYTNGVSGFSQPVLFGTICYEGKEYNVGYPWGKMSITRYLDGIENCWHFHQAPWQETIDKAYYALPKAKIW